jgi:uncharacterized ferritin-like protein (DUF455 family)
MPSDLRLLACAVLKADSIETKLAALDMLANAAASGWDIDVSAQGEDVARPGRPERPLLVPPKLLPKRSLLQEEGRAALLHAIAHIEFNAIDLACDAVQRFPDMPAGFYTDWISVAADEARHFRLLQNRLSGMGYAYGDFAAHDGLWEMALRTRDDCLARMALVPRVLEARGLDVTPGMIAKFEQTGDGDSIAVLEIILREEVSHVAIGTRWFNFCCQTRGCDPETTFLDLLQDVGRGALRGPYNAEARRLAGFTPDEMRGITALANNAV